MALMLCISFSLRKYEVLSSSGVLVYQYNVPVIEVFEGGKSRCYSGFIDTKKQIYFNRMIKGFNRQEVRHTDTIVKTKLLKWKSVDYISVTQGENEIQVLEKVILFKTTAVSQTHNFNLDSARMFIVSK